MRSVCQCVSVLALTCAIGIGCVRQEMFSQSTHAEVTPPARSGASGIVRPLWPPPPHTQPKNDKARVFHATFYAREKSKRDPDGAIADLESALGLWPEYDADIHYGIAMAVDRNIPRSAQASAERLGLYKRKLEHLDKARACINAGGNWANDPMKTRSNNLRISIEQARICIKRLSPGSTPAGGLSPGEL